MRILNVLFRKDSLGQGSWGVGWGGVESGDAENSDGAAESSGSWERMLASERPAGEGGPWIGLRP